MSGSVFKVSIIILLIISSFNFVGSTNNEFEQDQITNISRSAETVVINEFMSDPASDWDGDLVYDYADDEWIELNNFGPSPINISGWYINDSSAKRYTFPIDTIIPPGGFYVAYGSNSSLSFNNGGDTVKLFNSTDFMMDSYSYVQSYDDISFGRLPDGDGNWTEFNKPTPGRTNGETPKLVINEIMYDPAGSDTGNEWIEIFNNDTKTINITSWQLTDQDGDVDFMFGNSEFPYIEFPPQKYLLLHTSNGEPELDFGDGMGKLYMDGSYSIFNNDGDDVLLNDRGGLCIDYMAYGKSENIDPPPTSSEWNGTWYDSGLSDYVIKNPNPDADYGSTIMRKLNGQDSDSVADWDNASGPEITPGRSNYEIFGFDVQYDELVKYVNTGEQVTFNLTVINTGKIILDIKINSSKVPRHWSTELSQKEFQLGAEKFKNISVMITAPNNIAFGNELNLNISVMSENVNLNKNITLTAIIPAVDIIIEKFTIDGSYYVTDIPEGDIAYLKATINNQGNLDGGRFSVGFYHDEVNEQNILGVKDYDYIYDQSNKYPAIYWDTIGFQGNYTLIILADIYDDILEPNEDNNRFEYNISIIDTDPAAAERQMLITEVFYDSTIAYDPSEYVKIHNPSQSMQDLSGWQITDDPDRDFDETITLPDNTWLPANQSLYITNDAEAFVRELGFEPDFGCIAGNLKNVKLLNNEDEWPGFSNNGDLVILRDDHRHIIDMMCYGNSDPSCCPTNWHDEPVPGIPEGKIFKRQREQLDPKSAVLTFKDTDSKSDWQVPRLYGPGQSDFYPIQFQFIGEVIPFVSPENSYHIITQELDSAEDYIWLNVYELTHPLLTNRLIKAINRGVQVRILLEGNPVGWNFSNVNDPSYVKDEEYSQKYLLTQLYNSGARIKFLSDIKNDNKIKSLNKRYNYNHAKYCIIDDDTCFLMSGNWKPTSVPVNNTFGNREWGVVIRDTGLAEYLKEVFQTDWEPFSEKQNDTHFYDPSSNVYGPPPEFFNLEYSNSSNWYEPMSEPSYNRLGKAINGDFVVEPVLSPDTSTRHDSGIIGMIDNAEETVLIQQMDCNIDWRYLYKSSNELVFNWSDSENNYLNWLDGNLYYNEYLTAAIDAAKRGCVVKILLDSRYVELDAGPGKIYPDSEMDNLDTVQYINKLAILEGITDNLEARLCYLSGLEKIHNKGVIVDSEKALISSINWNYNSVTNNRELGVIITNDQVAVLYEGVFNYDWSRSISVNKPSKLTKSEKSLIFTEFYPDTYLSYDSDEYFAITNPTNDTIDISGWIITDKLTHYTGYDGALLFPLGSTLPEKSTIYIARTADTFYSEHNFLPDFEFYVDSRADVPQLEIIDSSSSASRGIQLANKGDELVLTDEYLYYDLGFEGEHIVDLVVYGNSSFILDKNSLSYPFVSTTHWQECAIYNVSEGEILKRNRIETQSIDQYEIQGFTDYMDTNSASDWENYHVYHPGQSDFWFYPITYSGSTTVFSSPDSSYQAISTELDNARETIYLSIYQFHNLYLMDKLINASERGVDVKVLIDGAPVGGLTDLGRYVAKQLVDSGCEVRFIRGVSKDNIHRRYKFLHSKCSVIDNITSIVMSENWKLSGVPVDTTIGNRGWGVVLRNSNLAENYADVFFSDWNLEMKDILAYNESHNKYGAPPEDFIPSWTVYGGDYKPRFQGKTINGEFTVTPVVAPDTTSNKYKSILELINSAQKSLCIEQLQCYINWDTKSRDIRNLYLEAAISAARRGCEVKIILDSAFAMPDNPGLDNYDTVQYINSVAKSENLTENLEAKLIYLTGSAGRNELSILHNKGIIVDGKKTLVSSINWATGSIIYNREVGVIIENTKVARFYTELFNYDWNLSVQELLKVYVMYSDMREIPPGDSTEYIISILNTQPKALSVNLSITDILPGWDAELDLTTISLPGSGVNGSGSKPIEVRLKVTAPTQDYIDKYLENLDGGQAKDLLNTLEMGIIAETEDMSAEVVFTTTHLLDSSSDPKDKDDKDKDPGDRSVIDPVMVIVLLGLMIIIGAVARDVIHAKMKKKKDKKKASEEEMEE